MTFHEGMVEVYYVVRHILRGIAYVVVACFLTGGYTAGAVAGAVVPLAFLLGYSTSAILRRLNTGRVSKAGVDNENV